MQSSEFIVTAQAPRVHLTLSGRLRVQNGRIQKFGPWRLARVGLRVLWIYSDYGIDVRSCRHAAYEGSLWTYCCWFIEQGTEFSIMRLLVCSVVQVKVPSTCTPVETIHDPSPTRRGTTPSV